MEAFYFAYGDADAYVIVDVPDAVVRAGVEHGRQRVRRGESATVPLITPEEMDAACKKNVNYRAPGA